MIQLQNVTKRIKENTVLDNVSYTFKSGFVYGLYGQNGSGKTMLLRNTAVTQLTSGNLTAQTVTKSPKQRGTKSVQQLYLKLRTILRKKTMMSSLSSTESRDLSRSIPTISAIRL